MSQENAPGRSESPALARSSESTWAAIKERLFTRETSAGVVVSAAPTIIFVAVNAVASLNVAILAAGISAVAALTYRAARREPVISALVGAAIVTGCATVAALTRQARGFFLLPTLLPFLIIVVCVASMTVRRPLSGVILNRVAGGPPDWHRHTRLCRVYTVSTMTFVAVNVVNAALQVPLYLYGETSLLAISHIVTQPAFVGIVAATLVFARRAATRAGEPDQQRIPSNHRIPGADR